MKRKKLLIIAGIIGMLLVSVVSLTAFSSKKKVEQKYTSYKVMSAEDLNFSGTIKAQKIQSVAYDSVSGEIASITVQNGADVKAGDILISYFSKENQLALNEKTSMKTNYETNIGNLNRELQEEQYKYNQANYANDEAKKQAAETNMNSIQASITQYQDLLTDVDAQIASLNSKKESSVVAEFDGKAVVDETAKRDAAKPVVTVYSSDRVAEFTVTEFDVEKIALNQEVKIMYKNQDKTISGKISYKSEVPKVDSGSAAVYTSEVSMDEKVPLGYSVKIGIQQNEIKIPADAVVTEGKEQFVYIYKNGKANKQKIVAEVIDGETFLLKEGLKEKESIIRKSKDLKDKMEVTVDD
ncbi:efflux RND transporter periplasmic adaptor subunit [Enterococcus sp. LJL128]|uniref:efflux RND transporter periplasmic adaptor subunit n=1 Tax=Enterococcus sp. LJL51 TaxID=3416656 RepID=UPI003CF5F6E8